MNALAVLLAANPGATGLLAAIVLIGVVTLRFAPQWIDRGVLRPYWLLRRRSFGTLLSNAFLHADLPHLLFNAFSFWAFGFALERSIGTTRFLQLYFFGLFVGDLGTWLRHRHDPDYGTLGASGAIMAVLFASIGRAPSQSIVILPIPVPIPAPLFAVLYLAFTVHAARKRIGGVNHDAHFGGALAGLAFIAWTDPGAWRRVLQAVGFGT